MLRKKPKYKKTQKINAQQGRDNLENNFIPEPLDNLTKNNNINKAKTIINTSDFYKNVTSISFFNNNYTLPIEVMEIIFSYCKLDGKFLNAISLLNKEFYTITHYFWRNLVVKSTNIKNIPQVVFQNVEKIQLALPLTVKLIKFIEKYSLRAKVLTIKPSSDMLAKKHGYTDIMKLFRNVKVHTFKQCRELAFYLCYVDSSEESFLLKDIPKEKFANVNILTLFSHYNKRYHFTLYKSDFFSQITTLKLYNFTKNYHFNMMFDLYPTYNNKGYYLPKGLFYLINVKELITTEPLRNYHYLHGLDNSLEKLTLHLYTEQYNQCVYDDYNDCSINGSFLFEKFQKLKELTLSLYENTQLLKKAEETRNFILKSIVKIKSLESFVLHLKVAGMQPRDFFWSNSEEDNNSLTSKVNWNALFAIVFDLFENKCFKIFDLSCWFPYNNTSDYLIQNQNLPNSKTHKKNEKYSLKPDKDNMSFLLTHYKLIKFGYDYDKVKSLRKEFEYNSVNNDMRPCKDLKIFRCRIEK